MVDYSYRKGKKKELRLVDYLFILFFWNFVKRDGIVANKVTFVM